MNGAEATTLNAEQLRAVRHPGGPLLIVAGAGTGKTTVITERIAWLVLEQHLPADQILAMTFTDKAAGELVERLDRRLPLGYVDVAAQTFHSLCQRVVQEHGLELGLPDRFKVLDTTATWLLVRRHLDRFRLAYYRPLGNPTRFIHALLKHFSRCKDEAVTPERYLAYAEGLRLDTDGLFPTQAPPASTPDGATAGRDTLTAEELKQWRGSEVDRLAEVAEAYHTYQQLLWENHALDFGDLILWALQLLRERPGVLARYRAQFCHVLVDEFQDTNFAQYQLVKLLAAPANNVTVVGDDDQSIYKFRGASVANILQFKHDYPGCTRVVLTANYRSRQEILDLAYRSIQHNNPNRLEAQLEEGLSKQLQAATPGTGTIEWLHGRHVDDEVALVAAKIQALHAASPDPSYNDFAILVRANDHAVPFVQGLQRLGVPVQFFGSRGLYQREVVRDATSYLNLLDDYHDSSSLYRVLRWPQWGIPAQELVLLTHLANRKRRSLYEVAREADALENLGAATKAQLRAILELVERHTRLAREKSVAELVYRCLKDTSYLDGVTQDAETAAGQATLRDLQAWYSQLQEFEAEGDDPSARAYLERLRLELESGETGTVPVDPEAGPEMVKVLTVHGAKGLEFCYVFVANLVELRFPSTERRETIELPAALVQEPLPGGDVHLQEERRLFYVACTRAQEGLFFTTAETYGGPAGRQKRPSIFLRELELTSPEPVGMGAERIRPPLALAEQDELQLLGKLLPSRYSFTHLEAFERCALYHRFAYLYRLPLPGSAALSFGNSIHLALQEFGRCYRERSSLQQGNLFGAAAAPAIPTEDELLNLLEAKWIDDWYDSPQHQEEYRQRGKEMLKSFYQRFIAQPPKTVAIEQGYSARLDGYRLYAKIDRIDETPEGWRLMDYKTGQTPKTTAGGHLPDKVKRQLVLYQAALQQVPGWKQKPVHELCYYYLGTDEQFTFTAAPDDVAKVLEWGKGVVEDIIASLKIPTSQLSRCGRPDCDICRIFNDSNVGAAEE